MNGTSLGSCELGATFTAIISNRNFDGDQSATFLPTEFDIVDPVTLDIISGFSKVPLIQTTDIADIWFIVIDTSSTEFQFQRATTYGIIVRDLTGFPLAIHTYNFTILPWEDRIRQGFERLEYLRNNQENVLFPRLKRLLGLAGENMFLDQFSYDDASNILGLRIRLFSNRTTAQLAARDIADSDLPEIGEIATYRVTQDMSLPRSLRVEHLSHPDIDEADSPANDNLDTDQDFGPGNEGGWPVI